MVFLLALLSACNSIQPASHYRFSGGKLTRTFIADVLRQNPLPPNQNIKVTDLGNDLTVSHHLVQVRFAEPLHIHRNHDLTVLVYSGRGKMTLGTNQFVVTAGDVIFVPKDVPHRFENTGRVPAVAIVAFTPGLTRKDFEPVGAQ